MYIALPPLLQVNYFNYTIKVSFKKTQSSYSSGKGNVSQVHAFASQEAIKIELLK